MRSDSTTQIRLRKIATPVLQSWTERHGLSPTEESILLEATVGTSRKRVTRERRITELTFKRHVSNLLHKLGDPSLLHAVARLLRELIAVRDLPEARFAMDRSRQLVYGRGMPNLQSTLERLAADFAAAAVAAIQHASLDDIAGLSRATAAPAPRAPRGARPARAGRPRRRSAADIGEAVGAIAALLAKHAGGLRAEQIRAELGLPRKELPRPLVQGLEAGKFRKRGQKRATVYFVGAGPSISTTPKAKPAKDRGKAKRRPAKKATKKKTPSKKGKRAAAA